MAKPIKTKGKPGLKTATPPPLRQQAAEPATRCPWNLPRPWSIALGLGSLLVFLLLLRWHLLDIPLERDESSYAYIGKRILDGQIPYRDVYEMKPPLLLYSYAALVAIFGYSQSALHWAALVLSFWNGAWVMAIGGRYFGRFYGYIAGLCYILLVANPFACAIIAESELLVMGFVLPGIYCLMRWEYGRRSVPPADARAGQWRLFAAGMLLACGVLIKQTAVFFFGWALLPLLLVFTREKPLNWRRLVRNGLALGAGALVPVAVFALLMLAMGAWDDFWYWNIQYPQTYVSGLQQDLWMTAFVFNFSLLTQNFELYWLLGIAGLLVLPAPVLPGRFRLLLAGLVLFSLAAVTPGRRFYGHYWLQFLPALALLMAGLFYHIERGAARLFLRLNLRPLMAGLMLIALLIPVARYGPTLFKGDNQKLIRSMFPGNPCVEDKILSELIAARIQPGDRIAVLGSEPQYYVYLNRNAPSKHFFMAFMMRPIPESEGWQQETLDSIVTQKPRFIVFNFVPYSWMPKKDSRMTLYQGSYKFARDNYRPIAWADIIGKHETNYILRETEALTYQPKGDQYVTVYEYGGSSSGSSSSSMGK